MARPKKEGIRVNTMLIADRNGKARWVLYWLDPESGKRRTKYTDHQSEKDAIYEAGQQELELRRQYSNNVDDIGWDRFVELYQDTEYKRMKPKTRKNYDGVFSMVEQFLRPVDLKDINTLALDRYRAHLREEGKAFNTIAKHMRHLKTAMRWAQKRKCLSELPDFGYEISSSGEGTDEEMKGRPITLEEFERMLSVLLRVIIKSGKSSSEAEPDTRRIPYWQHLLEGLWLSGLRSGEAYMLRWDDLEHGCYVNQTDGLWSIRFPKGFQKNGKRQDHPITSDFQAFLQQTPQNQRTGWVFNPIGNTGERVSQSTMERNLRKTGCKANVRVSDSGEKVSYAGCHTLRRSFGTRWSSQVTPSILKQLMRHKSITTTERYYVSHSLENIAEVLAKVSQQMPLKAADQKQTNNLYRQPK